MPPAARNDGTRNEAFTEPKIVKQIASSQKNSGGLSW